MAAGIEIEDEGERRRRRRSKLATKSHPPLFISIWLFLLLNLKEASRERDAFFSLQWLYELLSYSWVLVGFANIINVSMESISDCATIPFGVFFLDAETNCWEKKRGVA